MKVTVINKRRCHTPKNHQPKQLLHGWKPKLKSFKRETFMSTVRWKLTQAGYEHTFGYITKAKRRELNLEKSQPVSLTSPQLGGTEG